MLLRSGKQTSKMADQIPEWVKEWMTENRIAREEDKQRYEEEKKRYEEEMKRKEEEDRRRRVEDDKRRAEDMLKLQDELRRRDEENKAKDAERQREREEERRRYEELVKRLTEKKSSIEIGPESLKLKKLTEAEDIEAYLTTYERAVDAHNVDKTKWSVFLAPQLTGKALQAFAAMGNEDSKDYEKVKEAIFRRYDINEETYRQRFRTVKWKENETPLEMVTRLQDLAEKWLKKNDSKEAVIDAIVREQFVSILPEDAKVWVKEHKPDSSEKAGRLAEDFRQARKKEMWEPTTKKTSKRCNSCGKIGHLARDCYQGREEKKTERRNGQSEEPERKTGNYSPVCYNCNERGHVSRVCPKKALFCGLPKRRNSRKEQGLLCSGRVGERAVDDIQLDTGCSRTLVRAELVDPHLIRRDNTVTIQCAHGDTVIYPLADVTLEVKGKQITVEAAVSKSLPRSVLLGTDVPELGELLGRKKTDHALVVMTRSQRREQEQEEERNRTKEQNCGVRAKPVMEAEVNLGEEFNFDQELFHENIEGQQKRQKTRAEKREERYQHGRAEKEKQLMDGRDWTLNITKEELKRMQERDSTINELEQSGRDGAFFRKNGLLYRRWTPKKQTGDTVEQLVLPQQCRKGVLTMAHAIPFAGHMGRDKTARRIQQRFYWPTLFKDVAEFCKTCEECQRTRSQRPPRVPLVPLPIMNEPFERIAIDIVGPLPKSRKGNRYILVICDYATRYPEAIPMRNIDAESVAEVLINFFSTVGIPKEILSDQGSNFMSQLLKEMYRLLGIHPIRTTPYHPQTDGLVERFNKTLKSLLRRTIKEEGRDWDRLLPYVLFAYREVPQTSTGFSPFELLYGREVRGPLDVLKEEWEASERSNESVVSHILDMREKMELMTSIVEENLKETQQNQRRWYDRTARDRNLEVNEEVLVLLPTSTNKLLAEWQGPYKVLRKVGKTNYEILIKNGNRKRKKVFHINMLKKWYNHSFCAEEVKEEELEPEDDEEILGYEKVDSGAVTSGKELSIEQKEELYLLLQQFRTVINSKPGRTSVTRHHIRTGEGNPVRQHPYRIPHMYRESVIKELKEMIEDGIIEPSEAEWASPMVIVKKKDGGIRICIDYRKLNSRTKTDSYPMPRIDDILDQIGQARFITTLDLVRGYWQVPVEETDKSKTAFTTPLGLFQFQVMPFGLTGAPATFQRLMDSVIRGANEYANAYLDDVVIFSNTWREHMEHLRDLLTRLEEAGLTVKPSKCQFAMSECRYLGHIIGKGKVQPEKDKLDAIRFFPVPTTKKEVRSFLGLAGYYRRFIPNFATTAVSLTNLTRKQEPERVSWTSECDHAFNALKAHLMSTPVLWNPNVKKPFVLQTDASDYGIGAVLSQYDDDGIDHPVAFYSRKLLPRECKYATVEKECLAIKLGVQTFQVYLLGQEFTIQTDHRALQWMENFKNTNSRLTRWSLTLQPFKFRIEHRKGRLNANADSLSRVGGSKDVLRTKKGERSVVD